MIVTSVLANLHAADTAQQLGLTEAQFGALHRERAVLSGADLTKRIQRLITDHGRELGVRLPAGHPDLRDGDVLLHEAKNLVVVSVRPSRVLVIAPRGIEQALFTAHSLGNRHLQAQFFGADSDYGAEVMVVQEDHTVRDFLDHHGVPYTRQERVMPVPFRHAGHTH